jgi:hypothetical protein
MKIAVGRDIYTTLSTQGQLYLDDVHECFTLEPPTKTDGTKPRAIDNGTYPLTIRWSVEHNCHCPHVENVPSFTAIEQHIGNFPKDTLGCTLVGAERNPEQQPNFIGESLVAFTQLMHKYLAVAVLTNPNAPEKEKVWNVGEITYYDASGSASDPNGEVSV